MVIFLINKPLKGRKTLCLKASENVQESKKYNPNST